MPAITLSFYAPDTGALIGTLDDTQCKDIEQRPALFELGAGSFKISRHLAAASLAKLAKGNIVVPTVPAIQEEHLPWGFIIRDDVAQLISRNEQGGEDLTVTGPGLMAVLDNARLDDDWFAPSPPASDARGSSDQTGVWFWRAQPYGAIFKRAVEEGQSQFGTPLGLVTTDFDRSDDSDGTPWFVMANDYQVAVGTSVLELADRLSMTGQFTAVMVPIVTDDVLELRLSAYQSYGTDLSATVSFDKGVNILTELTRRTKYTRITHLIIKNLDGAYTRWVTPNAFDQATYGYLEANETNDGDTTEQIGTTALNASELNNEEYELEVAPDQLPFRDYGIGDEVRVHTGTGPHDLNNTAQRVVAARIVLDDASRDSTTTELERSLRIVLELSYRNTSGLSGTNPTVTPIPGGSRPIPYCRPMSLGDVTNFIGPILESDPKVKASGMASGFFDWQAADQVDATAWSTNGFPVNVQSWLYDAQAARSALSWRILQSALSSSAATSVQVWGTNDPDIWDAYDGTQGYDFSGAGWTTVELLTGLGTNNNAGSFSVPTTAYRYWAFDATAGGGNGWEVFTFELHASLTVGDPNDGRLELVGSGTRVKRCDDTEHYHTDSDPTTDDDWETGGWRNGTLWVNDATGAMFLLLDNETGDWLELGGGGSGPDLSDDTPLVESGSGGPGTSDEASRSDHFHPADGGGGGGGGLTHTYYGRTTVGASWVTAVSARVLMKKITLSSAGFLAAIGAYIRQTADTSSLSVELFSDSGGNPGLLIGHSRAGVGWQYGDLKLSASGTGTGRWVDFPMASYLPAGSYWIAVAGWKNEGSNIDIAYDSSGGSDRYFAASQANGGHMLDPASVTSPGHDYSIRASVLT